MSETPCHWESSTPFGFSGVRLLDVDVASAVDALAAAAKAKEPQGLHLCNAYTLALATSDAAAHRSLSHEGAVNLPDGTPVSWFFVLSTRGTARGPVRGPDLMREALTRPGLRHFLLGGTDKVLRDLEGTIETDSPGTVVCGRVAPPFRRPTGADLDTWTDRIRASGADVVWVGLGTPKQDEVIAALTGRVPAVLVGVGAAFDFLSGHKAQAPRWLHRTGLEWVYRLLQEPGRLWRRYLFGNSRFLATAAREVWANRTSAGR